MMRLIFLLALNTLFIYGCGEDNRESKKQVGKILYNTQRVVHDGKVADPGRYLTSVDFSDTDPVMQLIVGADPSLNEPDTSFVFNLKRTQTSGTKVTYLGENKKLKVTVAGEQSAEWNYFWRFSLSATGVTGIELSAIRVFRD